MWLCYGGNYRELRQDGLMSSHSKQWEGLDVMLGNGARKTQRKGVTYCALGLVISI